MAEIIDMRENADGLSVIDALMQTGDAEICPCNSQMNLDDSSRYKKLELSPGEKIQVSSLLQHVPAVAAASQMTNTYVLTIPGGLPYTLMKTKAGELIGVLVGPNGRIVHIPRLTSLGPQAAMLNVFTAMSVASSQYFLAQINREMSMMRQSLDKILEFLYGDKKAELMSEVSFTKYAFQNYSSIMLHESQRLATITGLQEAKKVAMKDVEFYLDDLDSLVLSKDADILSIADKSFQIKESFDLSIQLCVMSTLLEVYYAENFEPDYLQDVEESTIAYISKCDKRILNGFAALGQQVAAFKGNMLKKVNKEPYEARIAGVTDSLMNGGESELCKAFRSTLHSTTAKSEYYITDAGDVYVKAC